MTSTFIELNQLSEEDFIGIISQGKLEIKVKPKLLRTFDMPSPARSVATFVDTKADRRRLTMQGNFGILHLDFTCRNTALGANAWSLPTNSPTPVNLIEFQVRNGGTIWIEQGSRQLRWSGLEANQRYVADLIGFWE